MSHSRNPSNFIIFRLATTVSWYCLRRAEQWFIVWVKCSSKAKTKWIIWHFHDFIFSHEVTLLTAKKSLRTDVSEEVVTNIYDLENRYSVFVSFMFLNLDETRTKWSKKPFLCMLTFDFGSWICLWVKIPSVDACGGLTVKVYSVD